MKKNYKNILDIKYMFMPFRCHSAVSSTEWKHGVLRLELVRRILFMSLRFLKQKNLLFTLNSNYTSYIHFWSLGNKAKSLVHYKCLIIHQILRPKCWECAVFFSLIIYCEHKYLSWI